MDFDKFFEEENEEQGYSLDYKRFLRGIYKRKWIVLGVFIVVIIPWLLYVNSQPPEYEAYTSIQFKNYDPEHIRSLNSNRYIELTSRTFAEKVVAQLGLAGSLKKEDKKEGLMRQDVFVEFFTSQNPESGKYLLRWQNTNFTLYRVSHDEKNSNEIAAGDISQIIDKNFSINGFTFRLKPELLQRRNEIMFRMNKFRDAVRWFQSRIRISMVQGGTMMVLKMTYDNPEIVAQMVNSLAEIYVNESISFEKKNAENHRVTIQSMLKAAKEKLDTDQQRLEQFQKEHIRISLDVDIERKINNLSSLQQRKSDLEFNMSMIKDLLLKLNEFNKITITPGQEDSEIRYIYTQIAKNPLFQNNATMGINLQELERHNSERQDLLERLQPSSNLIIDIDRKIVEIQSKIYSDTQQILRETENNLIEIDRQIDAINREIYNLPTDKRELANLQGEVETSQQIYNNYLMESSKLSITDTINTKEIKILDPAIPPEFPINRGKKRNAVIGGLLALFFSVGLAIFLEFMDKSVKSPEDIKKYLKLNVIGSIPKVDFANEFELKDADKLKQIDSQLVTYDYSPTPIGEAYRALRTKIVFSKNTGKIRTFVITSFAPADGKSFTSANLSITLAQHKTNTLLVDSDLRRGVLHNTFGIPKEPGFSNYLMGMTRFEQIVNETYIPNLSLVSCGSMMPNPSELLGSTQLKRFIDEARKRYDIVVFDSPPLNAATDSVVLGTQSDGVILIVRADVTNRNIAKQKLDLFDNVPANVIGVILNGADTELAHDGYSYYHY